MECCLRLVVIRNVETRVQISSCIVWFASDQVLLMVIVETLKYSYLQSYYIYVYLRVKNYEECILIVIVETVEYTCVLCIV